jgi:putative ABC transport system ATP-binding protein
MIECTNITKSYGVGDARSQVLKGISLSIERGEFVAIMGPSGSGKSTLMNMLGCLDTPTSGTYVLDGEDVSTLSDDALASIRSRKIGFVFQAFNLLSRATVMRNVTLPLIYTDIPHDEYIPRGSSALTSAGLPSDRWEYKTNQLSGGQMQRVAIARALVVHPDIVFADEPTGNLDSRTGEIVIGTLQRLNEQEGTTVILITHDLDTALHAQRIIQIKDGLVVEDKRNQHQTQVSDPTLL